MKTGDKFTVAGLGYSSKGKLVKDGKLWGTNRKCKAVRTAVFTVAEILGGEVDQLTPIKTTGKASPDLATDEK